MLALCRPTDICKQIIVMSKVEGMLQKVPTFAAENYRTEGVLLESLRSIKVTSLNIAICHKNQRAKLRCPGRT